MNKLILMIIGLVILSASCSKTNKKNVTYISTGAISAYNLQYLSENDELITTEVTPQSAQDEWEHSHIGNNGDIIYLSGHYKDINSSLKIMILIDGKIYKQASNEADTISYLTISGTVSYE